MRSQGDSWEHDRIHADPAIVPDHDVFPRLVRLEVIEVMVSCDDPDVRGDVTASSDVNCCCITLEIAAERLEVVYVVWMKNDSAACRYRTSRAHRPRCASINSQYFLSPKRPDRPFPTK